MKVWLGLMPGSDDRCLVESAVASGAVLDVTSAPAYWGHLLEDSKSPVCVFAGQVCRGATSREHAHALMMADIVALVSAVQRDRLDYLIFASDGLTAHQLEGGVRALKEASADGVVGQIGAYTERGQFDESATFKCGAFSPVEPRRDLNLVCRTVRWDGSSPFFGCQDLAKSDELVRATVSLALESCDVLVGVRSAHETNNALKALNDPASDEIRLEIEETARRRACAV